ncbi:MAG TPA: PQQ-binding-like beta-propeller repeat protein [Vicinamibacterales bacterium]|nr:PQQ-binding-like beta-propeller repeat protein [Vicinamibacterales bacterium]
MRTIATLVASLTAVLAAAFVQPAPVPAAPAESAEWRSYGRDLGNSRYSPLDLLNRDTLGKVQVVWRWRSDNFSVPPEDRNESTPIMVDGTLYFTTGAQRWVVAADAATGATKWTWHLDEGDRARRAPRKDSGRGVSFWSGAVGADGRRDDRIFTVTPGFNLVALDAKTGAPVAGFGDHGVVDLKAQLGVPVDLVSAAIGSSSPPLVFENVVVIGPALEVGTRPPSMKNVPGRILAVDARTGALLWRFNTIPQKGEFGYETWENGSAEYTGNAGAWAPLTLDAKRGYLYLPVEAATGDYYGGHRLGDDLFSSTLVCLDARTGRRVWHFQIVHHDIWDRDNAAAPILADVTVNGQRVEAVVQLTKQAYAYVFDRVTGKPVWPIVEKPMPRSDVPGERAAATQPIPSKPAPFDRQGVTVDDLIDFTPELRAEALAAVKPFRLGESPFTPPSVANGPDGTRGTLMLPGTLGGANWEGGAFDPETGMLYVGSWTNLSAFGLTKDPLRSDMDWGGTAAPPRVRGLPIIKPPYSRITAIDLNTGEHAWMVPSGDTPPAVKSHPALAGLTIPPTGAQSRPVVLATKTLLFTAEGSSGQPFLRALDKKTGERVWEMPLPGAVGSVPMTYAIGDRQFLAFWVSNRQAELPATLIAIAIPAPGRGGRGGQ